MTPMLTLLTDRPSLSLWAQEPGHGPTAWSLSCPRCRRVFRVTDEQPLLLHGPRRRTPAAASREITVRGEIVCPYDCGAQFSVEHGQVQWRKASEHRIA